MSGSAVGFAGAAIVKVSAVIAVTIVLGGRMSSSVAVETATSRVRSISACALVHILSSRLWISGLGLLLLKPFLWSQMPRLLLNRGAIVAVTALDICDGQSLGVLRWRASYTRYGTQRYLESCRGCRIATGSGFGSRSGLRGV